MVTTRRNIDPNRTAVSSRHLILSSNEKLKLQQRKKLLTIAFHRYAANIKPTRQSINDLIMLNASLLAYHRLMYRAGPEKPLAQPHVSRTIVSFSESDCWTLFRIRQADLPRLMVAFQIPAVVILDNRSCVEGEELLLFALHRFARGTDIRTSCTGLFGRDSSQWSRAFHWFVSHMVDNFADLLCDNVDYWVPHFGHFAECIRKKIEQVSELIFDPTEFRVVGFVDDNVSKICRPGVGAPRNDNFMQMAFYNGWKKHHGIKWQSAELPNGMTMDMYGPMSFRHNDMELLHLSGLNDRLEAAQVEYTKQFYDHVQSAAFRIVW